MHDGERFHPIAICLTIKDSHSGADVVLNTQDAFGGETLNCFADGHTTHPQCGGKWSGEYPVVRLEFARIDLFFDVLIRAVRFAPGAIARWSRSEERRVGRECRGRGATSHGK